MTDGFGFRLHCVEDAPLRSAQALADGMRKAVQIARALVDAGRPLDLAGLDEMVGRLCARVLDLPPEQGLMLQSDLREVLAEVDELHRCIVRERALTD